MFTLHLGTWTQLGDTLAQVEENSGWHGSFVSISSDASLVVLSTKSFGIRLYKYKPDPTSTCPTCRRCCGQWQEIGENFGSSDWDNSLRLSPEGYRIILGLPGSASENGQEKSVGRIEVDEILDV